MVRVIFDTNVFISALIAPHGVCAQIFSDENWEKMELIISEDIFSELVNVGSREHFRRYFMQERLTEFITKLSKCSLVIRSIEISINSLSIVAEKDDVHVASLFEFVKPKYLVTGNKKHFMIDSESLLSPREFLDIIKDQA